MNRVEELMLKLAAVVRVAGHTRVQNGKVVHVSAYTYTRVAIRSIGHKRGYDVDSGSAFRQLSNGHMLQISPEKTKLGTVTRGSIKDNNGNELFHITHTDPGKVFENIEKLAALYTGLGRFPEERKPQTDIAKGIRAGYPPLTTEEMRALLKKIGPPTKPARFR